MSLIVLKYFFSRDNLIHNITCYKCLKHFYKICIYRLLIKFEKKLSPLAILSKSHPLFPNVRLNFWYYHTANAILKIHDW